MLTKVFIGATVVAGSIEAGHMLAQAPQPATPNAAPSFEVASVKANKSGDGRVMIANQPGGRFTATGATLRLLIRLAYRVQDFQIIGAPDWADRFDVIAKAATDIPPDPPGAPPGPLQFMLQSLLAERFKLVVHRDTRDLPIYALTVARTDGKLGPGLRSSAVDCKAMAAAARARGGGPMPFPAPGERPMCGFRMLPGQLSGGGVGVSQLADALAPFVGRVVTDRTRLEGSFDMDMSWTPEQLPAGPPPPGAPPLPAIDPNGPSIFTALQEQLGLRLESQTGPVDVLVIDHVERPTPD